MKIRDNMTKLIVIDPIDATHEGPQVPVMDSDEEFQLLHLRQGDIDGACGPYCLFMALMICGAARREEITGSPNNIHGNTRLAKAFKLMEEYSALFKHGTQMEDLEHFVNKTYKKKVKTELCLDRGVSLRPFIEKHIKLNHPVILGLDWGGNDGHWVLVIGLEYLVDDSGQETLWRFLVLDPMEPASKVCAWNSVIEATGSGGKYPFVWWKDYDVKVQFDEGMALMCSPSKY
jgi:hypothetical protein